MYSIIKAILTLKPYLCYLSCHMCGVLKHLVLRRAICDIISVCDLGIIKLCFVLKFLSLKVKHKVMHFDINFVSFLIMDSFQQRKSSVLFVKIKNMIEKLKRMMQIEAILCFKHVNTFYIYFCLQIVTGQIKYINALSSLKSNAVG